VAELRLDRVEVFPHLIWRTNLEPLAGDREYLRDDILRRATTQPNKPGLQTDPVLGELTDEPWRHYHELVGTVVSSVVGQTLITMPLGRMVSWGLVFERPDDWDLGIWSLHSHYPATFSSVFYVEVPPELMEHGEGGTTFVDPMRHATRYFHPDLHSLAPEASLDLVVFPSYLEHRPTPPVHATVWSGPRVVVATDYYFS
jgi:hypothetical protein